MLDSAYANSSRLHIPSCDATGNWAFLMLLQVMTLAATATTKCGCYAVFNQVWSINISNKDAVTMPA